MDEIAVRFNDPNCPVRLVMDMMGNKWMVRVVYALSRGTRRYNELRRDISGISHKMLTSTLRELEEHGLVRRTVYPVIPPHVDYELTPLGVSFVETLWHLASWATVNREALLPEPAGSMRPARAQ